MAVIVAEYLGVRTDRDIPIQPIKISKNRGADEKPILKCPFKNSHCDKAKRGDKPICSLRDAETGELWIVCSHRLCATSPKPAPLNDHQTSILHAVAQEIYSPTIAMNDVLVKKEVPIKITEDSDYSADYVMWRKNPPQNAFPVVLEMQGGGETTNTGELTKHIDTWDRNDTPNNQLLVTPIRKVAPLVTNAWRRQQEQFLVKGNVATMTGGRMVFCVGSMIYDYLTLRFRAGVLQDLRNANWTLALLTFIEDTSDPPASISAPHAIPLKIDEDRSLFTSYPNFLQALINQGAPSPELFIGTYKDLEDESHIVT